MPFQQTMPSEDGMVYRNGGRAAAAAAAAQEAAAFGDSFAASAAQLSDEEGAMGEAGSVLVDNSHDPDRHVGGGGGRRGGGVSSDDPVMCKLEPFNICYTIDKDGKPHPIDETPVRYLRIY